MQRDRERAPISVVERKEEEGLFVIIIIIITKQLTVAFGLWRSFCPDFNPPRSRQTVRVFLGRCAIVRAINLSSAVSSGQVSSAINSYSSTGEADLSF